MNKKRCGKCYRLLSLSDFHNSKSSKDGHMSTCKSCRKGLTKAPTVPDGYRACRICGEIKPVSLFYPCKTATRKTCIKCSEKRWNKSYQNKTGRIGNGKFSLLGYLNPSDNANIRRSNPKAREMHRLADKKYKESEKGKAKKKQWADDHKYKRVFYNHTRNARMANLDASFTPEQWELTLSVFGRRCVYCGIPVENPYQEHYIPVVKGGPYKLGNIVPSCLSCNSKKRSRLPHEFLDKFTQYEIEKKLRGLQ